METLFERLMRDVVEVLNVVPRKIERDFIIRLEKVDSEMAEEIKKRLFVFDDIVVLDDRSIQKVLCELEMEELAQAMHGARPEARDKVLKNMSQRAAALLKEDIASVNVETVEPAQQRIVAIIRSMEKKGEIAVVRPDE